MEDSLAAISKINSPRVGALRLFFVAHRELIAHTHVDQMWPCVKLHLAVVARSLNYSKKKKKRIRTYSNVKNCCFSLIYLLLSDIIHMHKLS